MMAAILSALDDHGATTDLTSMERKFIKKYEELPILWKKDHPEYSNKFKRNLAYDLLLPILRTFIPNANLFNVRQKINILRSTYRKELRKYQASRTITENGEIIYTHMPPSWKFTAMKFLEDWNSSVDINGVTSDLSQSEVVIEETVEDDTYTDIEEQELVFIQDPDTESGNEEQDLHQNPVSHIYHENKQAPLIITKARKRKPSNSFSDAIIIDRECTAVGSNVTCKLQRMDMDQRYYAEQLINKVLMRGLRKTLSDSTDFTDAIMQLTKVES